MVVAGKVEIMKLSKLWIVAGVLLLTACQPEQTPTGSRDASIGTTVAEAVTQEGTDSRYRTAPSGTAKDEEGTTHGKIPEEVPAGTSTSGEAKLPDVFPLEFVFSSGAGAWRTDIVLNQDGSFNGAYLDSDMGDRGDDYPRGTQYICDFSGQFGNIRQMDSHTYTMTLSKITAEKENGVEWIEDGILNKYSEPYGMEDGTEYLLYTPDTKIAEVPEDFLNWYPGWNFVDEDGNQPDTLSCYGIYNVKMGYGFFVY